MGNARDIALIFLSLQALVMALVPVVILSALAYGVYRLCGITRQYLRLAQVYARKLYELVERISASAVAPLVRVHTTTRMVTTMVNNLISRR